MQLPLRRLAPDLRGLAFFVVGRPVTDTAIRASAPLTQKLPEIHAAVEGAIQVNVVIMRAEWPANLSRSYRIPRLNRPC